MRFGCLLIAAGFLLLLTGCLTNGVQSKDQIVAGNSIEDALHQNAPHYKFGCSNLSDDSDHSLCADNNA